MTAQQEKSSLRGFEVPGAGREERGVGLRRGRDMRAQAPQGRRGCPRRRGHGATRAGVMRGRGGGRGWSGVWGKGSRSESRRESGPRPSVCERRVPAVANSGGRPELSLPRQIGQIRFGGCHAKKFRKGEPRKLFCLSRWEVMNRFLFYCCQTFEGV